MLDFQASVHGIVLKHGVSFSILNPLSTLKLSQILLKSISVLATNGTGATSLAVSENRSQKGKVAVVIFTFSFAVVV